MFHCTDHRNLNTLLEIGRLKGWRRGMRTVSIESAIRSRLGKLYKNVISFPITSRWITNIAHAICGHSHSIAAFIYSIRGNVKVCEETHLTPMVLNRNPLISSASQPSLTFFASSSLIVWKVRMLELLQKKHRHTKWALQGFPTEQCWLFRGQVIYAG